MMAIKVLKRYLFTLTLSVSILVAFLMVSVYFLIATPLGGKLLVNYLLLQSAQSASVEVASFTGNLKEGLVLKNVAIRNWPMLGPGAVISIQRLEARMPVLDLKKIQAVVFNGRLDIPNSDPFLIQGRVDDGIFVGDVEARTLDVKELLRVFLKNDLWKMTRGTVSSVKFDVRGPVLNPGVKGGFVADKITYGDKVVRQVFAKVDVALGYLAGAFDMRGRVILDGGTVDVGKNTYDLLPSLVTYGQNIIDPDVDLRCTIHKDIYDIDLRVQGTVKYNKITAYADPYLPQEEAFTLLGMGSWLPLSSASLSLQSDAQALGIKRSLGDVLNVGYGFEQSSENFRGESNSLQFVQGQMKLSGNMSLNMEKEVVSSHDSYRYSRDDQRRENESRFYLKYQNNF